MAQEFWFHLQSVEVTKVFKELQLHLHHAKFT